MTTHELALLRNLLLDLDANEYWPLAVREWAQTLTSTLDQTLEAIFRQV